jgi:DNA (cytosine-5)-methyltransferase 1
MKVLDLFSGIGGFALAAEAVGWETIAFCEIEKYPQEILHQHFQNTRIWDDIRTMALDSYIGNIDLICGGFPCQDISYAKPNGKGLEGEKSSLWFDYLRLIKEIKPKVVVIENSANLRSKGLTTILKNLWEIGYSAQWDIFPASNFGASHRRERCFIVAHANEEGSQRFFKSYSYAIESIYKERFSECRFNASNPFQISLIPESLRVDDGLPYRSHRAKALGNAVYVPLITAIFESIKHAKESRE